MTIDSAQGSKRLYSTPKLVAYGDISSLTKTATGSRVEITVPPIPVGTMNGMRRP